MYNYLAIAALCASLSFTLAALFDRLFKLEVIINSIAELRRSTQLCDRRNANADLAAVCNSPQVSQHLINEVSASENDKSIAPNKNNNNNKNTTHHTQTNNDKTSKSRYKSTTHSELIRQLFGKSSAFLIGIIIALFYSHLLLIFGSLPSTVEQSRFQSPPISYKLVNDETKAVSLHKGYFSITRSKPDCTLLMTNQLPYIVFVFDIFLLPVISLVQIYACVLIWKLKRQKTIPLLSTSNQTAAAAAANKNETKRNQQQNAHVQTDSVIPAAAVTTSIMNNNYLLKLNCILGTAAFSFVLNIPSLIARVILMILFAASSNNQTISNDSNSFNSYSNVLAQTNNNNNNNNNERNASVSFNYSMPKHTLNVTMNGSPIAEPIDYFSLLNLVCNKLDILLLISTSHKFIIIATQCSLVQWWTKHEK